MPQPVEIGYNKLEALSKNPGIVIVDTRLDRSAFMRKHVSGALYAPLDKTFPTVAGSFIAPDTPIYLIVEREKDVQVAVLDLIRIGLDKIEGFILADVADENRSTSWIREIEMNQLEAARNNPGVQVLDVRRLIEFEESHVPGAKNIAHTRLPDRLEELDRKATHLIHCRSGARAAVAAALLKKNGFDVVYVNGDYATWAYEHLHEASV